ncbi:MAG: hypothetical protein WBG50_00105, partial [Desulfomonilaceae bacterium]
MLQEIPALGVEQQRILEVPRLLSHLPRETRGHSGLGSRDARKLSRNPASRGTFPNSWHDSDY